MIKLLGSVLNTLILRETWETLTGFLMSSYNSSPMPSTIIATGRAFPKRTVTNTELSKNLGIDEKEIEKKTGVQSRYWAGPGETCASLATEAAYRALASIDLDPNRIDLILVTTTSPEMYFPSTACLVQKNISRRSVPSFDINGSCSGFIYALSIADQYLRNGSAKKVLIVSSEVKSRSIDPHDRSTAILFGDGAGAAVLSTGELGIRKIKIGADGSRHKLICLPIGGSRRPFTLESLKDKNFYMKMEGKELFRTAVKTLERELHAFLKESAFSLDRIDHYIFHQANLRIIEALLRRNAIPSQKTHITLDRFGNTSSSSIPIAIDLAVEEGKLKKGDCLLLSAFGGGITWGNVLLDWNLNP